MGKKYTAEEKRPFNARIPEDLYKMLKKLCVDKDMDMTEVFVKYLRYLQKIYYKNREILDENSRQTFSLDD